MNDLEELTEAYESLIDSYEKVKRLVKLNEPHEFKRWEAGGFIIDDNVLSMYPSIRDIVEPLIENMASQEDEDDA